MLSWRVLTRTFTSSYPPSDITEDLTFPVAHSEAPAFSSCTSHVLKAVTPICKTATSFSMLLIGDITKNNDTLIALDMAVLSKKRHTN